MKTTLRILVYPLIALFHVFWRLSQIDLKVFIYPALAFAQLVGRALHAEQIFGLQPPSPTQATLEIGIFLCILLIGLTHRLLEGTSKSNSIRTLIELSPLGGVKICRSAEESIRTIDGILLEIEKHLKKPGASAHIREVNLQPENPGRIIWSHLRLVEWARKNGSSFSWRLLVADQNNDKEEWFRRVKKWRGDDSFFQCKYQKTNMAGFNFIVCREIKEVYLGMGKWQNNLTGGGIWIRDGLVADFLYGVFEVLDEKGTWQK